jgi:hypothetical protein
LNRTFCANDVCKCPLGDADVVEVSTLSPDASPGTQTAPDRDDAEPTPRAPAPTSLSDDRVRAVLTFPWGDVDVCGVLLVGRDPKLSPLGAQLEREGERYRWVSRQHAEIFDDDGRLHVRDMGSKNGTYVNGKLLDGRPVALFDGDVVAFSRRLVATVRLSGR